MEYTNSRIREIIAEYIHSERDRRILERRLIDGVTFEKLTTDTAATMVRTTEAPDGTATTGTAETTAVTPGMRAALAGMDATGVTVAGWTGTNRCG